MIVLSIKCCNNGLGNIKIEINSFLYGMFFYMEQEVDLLDIATIRDTRTRKGAKVPKDQKLRQIVTMGATDSLEDKTLTVVSGPDFVNISFTNFCCNKKETAKVRF